MALDSTDSGGFLLKPGGAMEEGLPTDLETTQYTHSSGITNTGRLIRTPGKRFVQQFADRVLQIAGFGGAVIIQHGSTLIMFPDACAVSPTDDDDSNVVIVNVLPITSYNKSFAHKETTYPWAAHPSVPRFGDGAVPVLYYYDYSFIKDDYTTTLNVGAPDNYMHRAYGCNAYTNAIRDASKWDYGCEIQDTNVTGVFDLTAYDPKVYQRIELIGDMNSYKTDQSGSQTTYVGNYELDITKHMGKANVEIGIPLPLGAPAMVWDDRRDSENTLLGNFLVNITGMKLTKFGPPDS